LAPDTSKGRLSDEKDWRPPKAEFLPSFSELQAAVRDGCERGVDWESKVAGGVAAALEFADSNPSAVHALTIGSRQKESDRGSRQDDVIRYFGEVLRDRVPAERRGVDSISTGIVEALAVMVRSQLVASATEPLASRAADAVYLTLVAFTDIEAAARKAEEFDQPSE
jgi:hypothetical protein